MFNKFCKDFPELAEKVDFINDVKLDTPDVTLYTSEKGVDSNGKGSNHSQEQGRSGQSLEREVGSDSGSPSAQNLMQGERTSGGTLNNGTVGKGLSTSDERGKASNGSDSKRQITKNITLTEKHIRKNLQESNLSKPEQTLHTLSTLQRQQAEPLRTLSEG